MNDKTIEIIIMLLGHLKEHNLEIKSLGEFSESLVVYGFSERDVTEALGWLFEKLNFMSIKSTEIAEQREESVRILHDFERTKISSGIYGHLLKLRNQSVITGSQMEKVIDYCILLGDDVTESDIDGIVGTILFQELE